jgi:hypothetical protein
MGTGFFFSPRGKGTREGSSPQKSAEIKKMWIYIFIPPYIIMT